MKCQVCSCNFFFTLLLIYVIYKITNERQKLYDYSSYYTYKLYDTTTQLTHFFHVQYKTHTKKECEIEGHKYLTKDYLIKDDLMCD